MAKRIGCGGPICNIDTVDEIAVPHRPWKRTSPGSANAAGGGYDQARSIHPGDAGQVAAGALRLPVAVDVHPADIFVQVDELPRRDAAGLERLQPVLQPDRRCWSRPGPWWLLS